MGRTEPFARIHPKRPTANLISKKVLTSLIGQIVLTSGFQIFTYLFIRTRDWYVICSFDRSSSRSSLCFILQVRCSYNRSRSSRYRFCRKHFPLPHFLVPIHSSRSSLLCRPTLSQTSLHESMARFRPPRTHLVLALHPLHSFFLLHFLPPRIRHSPSRLPPRTLVAHHRERCGELGFRRVRCRGSCEMDWRDAEEVEEDEREEKERRESLQGYPEKYGGLAHYRAWRKEMEMYIIAHISRDFCIKGYSLPHRFRSGLKSESIVLHMRNCLKKGATDQPQLLGECTFVSSPSPRLSTSRFRLTLTYPYTTQSKTCRLDRRQSQSFNFPTQIVTLAISMAPLDSQTPAKLPILADLAALPRVPDPVPSPSNSPSLDELTSQFTIALSDIRSRLPQELRNPKVGIVCGSGLQGLAELLQDRVEVNYSDITGFGESTGAIVDHLHSQRTC